MISPQPVPGLSERSPSAGDRWQRLPRRWRLVWIILAVVLGAQLVSSITGGIGGNNGASGPSSSFDSSASGTEAFAHLLVERGYDVSRLTDPLGETGIARRSTIFVLDPTDWNTSDTAALRRDLSEGNRVVLGGMLPASGALAALLASPPPQWRAIPAGVTHPTGDQMEVRGIASVVSAGPGTYGSPSGDRSAVVPLLVGSRGTLALIDTGPGTLVLLASSSALQNSSIGQLDNAAFALDLAGDGGSTVLFDEYDHGFGRPGSGLPGLPASWRWGLGIAVLAVLVWMLSAARRFGPLQEPERTMLPARRKYVDAMATLLSTRKSDEWADAIAPVRAEARRQLCRRLGLAMDASDEALSDAARLRSDETLDEGRVEAILNPVNTAAEVVAAGNALAQLERQDAYR